MAGDTTVVHNGRRRLTYLLAGAPILLIGLPCLLLGAALALGSGGEVFFHVAGLALVFAGFLVTWVFFLWLRLKPLGMTVSDERLELWQEGRLVADVAKEGIGCVLRCDSVLCVFDDEDRMIGRWSLQWGGVLSHGKFIKAMRRFDYPCRVWASVRTGFGGNSTIVETHRLGPLARDPELPPLGRLAVVGVGADDQLQGPGLTDGPVAEFFGLVDSASARSGETPVPGADS